MFKMTQKFDVSVITPAYNSAEFLPECLQSLMDQTFKGSIELCVYDDSSTDNSLQILEEWKDRFERRGISVTLLRDETGLYRARGPGYGRNKVIEACGGNFLCFLDSDDIMHRERIERQYKCAVDNPHALIGSRFTRVPPSSTLRYTAWANRIDQSQLYTQAYTSHGPTLILPTWFCALETFQRLPRGFVETGPNAAEDYILFLDHVHNGGELIRLPEDLMTYRCHEGSVTTNVPEALIWDIRVEALSRYVLCKWEEFTIWNAGKQGRRLYRSLDHKIRTKVRAFCDVDAKKISKGFYVYEDGEKMDGKTKPKVPIVHFTEAKPPFVICVKLDLTGGGFERNLESLGLREGVDYYHFN